MKRCTLLFSFLTIFLLNTALSSNGDPCGGETVITEHIISDDGNFRFGAMDFYGQSFELMSPTSVGGINLFVRNVGGADVTLNLHSGPDPTSDAIISSAICSITSTGAAHFIFPSRLELIPGEYVFSFSPTFLRQFEFGNTASTAAGAHSFWFGDAGIPSMAETATEFSISFQVVSCVEITGRDTTICIGNSVDLSTLIDSMPAFTLAYGEAFGTYDLPSSTVSPTTTTTYFVVDTNTMTMESGDTAMIEVTVLDEMECLMEFASLNEINFGDPCNCDNIEFENRGTYFFRDTLQIEAPASQTIEYSSTGSSDFYSGVGVEMADGTPIPEVSPGKYQLVFYKLNETQAIGHVTLNGRDPYPIPLADVPVCSIAATCPAFIPTMGQWGIIICLMLLLIVGVSSIKKTALIKA